MKILHIVPTYLPARRYGGPIHSVHGLCKKLAELGHEVHVFTTNVDGPNDSEVLVKTPVDVDGVKVWYFPSTYLRRLYYSPSMGRVLNREIHPFEILHLHSVFLWPTWMGAQMAKRKKIPYLISPRGMLVRSLINKKSRFFKSLWLELIERRNLENAAAIHATSEMEAEEIKRFHFKLPSVAIVPNGVDSEIAMPAENTSGLVMTVLSDALKKKPFILFLGRLNWKKGLDRLIPALSFVPEAHLVIAGNDEEGYQKVLEALAEKHGVKDRVTFTGPVYGEEKIVLLKQATILALPSYSENFGNVVLEAMAVGCPVVVTPEVGLAGVVKQSGAGLVSKGDPKILGENLKTLLSNSEQRQQMGLKGQKLVCDQFTWDSVAKQMEIIYQGFLKKSLRSL